MGGGVSEEWVEAELKGTGVSRKKIVGLNWVENDPAVDEDCPEASPLGVWLTPPLAPKLAVEGLGLHAEFRGLTLK